MSQNNPQGSSQTPTDESINPAASQPPPVVTPVTAPLVSLPVNAGESAMPVDDGASQGTPAKKEDTHKPLKLFSLNDVRRVVEVPVHWPAMYPGFEPWVFKFGLMLSDDVQKKREEWLGATPSESDEKANTRTQMMAEVGDLLRDIPTGFAELQGVVTSPGEALSNFVNRITDPEQKETVLRIIQAAWNGYWARALPTTFRQDVPNSGS